MPDPLARGDRARRRSPRPRRRAEPITTTPARRRARRGSRRGRSGGRCARRARRTPPATMPGTASWNGLAASRAWKKTSGFWAVPRTTGASGVSPRPRKASTSSSRTSARRSSSSSSAILFDLVASAEAVEEVQERHPRPQRRGVGDEREVVRLLHRAGGEHRPAGRAGVHHVAVVAEDRQGVGGDRAGGDVDDRRRQLAGDLEHVRDHQQQALRRRERRRQRALLQRAVERAGGAGLRLHLDDVGDGAPQVRPAGGRPVVAVLGHRRRGRDRVDRDHLADSA